MREEQSEVGQLFVSVTVKYSMLAKCEKYICAHKICGIVTGANTSLRWNRNRERGVCGKF